MQFSIKEQATEEDRTYFVAVEYQTARDNGFIPAHVPEEEAFLWHQQEVLQFVESKPRTGIFLARTRRGPNTGRPHGNHSYAGLVWISISENREPWDFQASPAWIYDLWVEPEYRRQGLGTKLLQQAERWARKAGLAKIGLHVFGSNDAAIRLYRSAGYRILNRYLQKEITPETQISPSPAAFRIRERQPARDDRHILALGYESYRTLALAGTEVSEQEMRARYAQMASKEKLDQANHTVHVAEDAGGAFAGFAWAYRSKGDLGEKRYVWLQDLQVHPGVRNRGLGGQLLAQVESWTLAQDLDTIRTGVHTHNQVALHLLRSRGYCETNCFMYKDTNRSS